MGQALESILPSIILSEKCKDKISNGNIVGSEFIVNSTNGIVPGDSCSIFCGNTFMGIGFLIEKGSREVIKMKSVLI